MQWSVVVREADTGRRIAESHPKRVLKTASIGKLVLLGYTGYMLLRDQQHETKHLDRRTVARITDSGIWQHLGVDSLTVPDVATLVFMSSDNLGTNVLLDYFGLDEVRRFGPQLGLEDTILLDLVREARGAGDPETLSVSSAEELSDFMSRLWRRTVVDRALSDWLLNGLSKSMDLSMIPQILGLDPLSHDGPRRPPGVANKTGTDDGIRADAGLLSVGSSVFAYAAICNYQPDLHADAKVLASMHEIGLQMVQAAGQGRRADAKRVSPGSSRPADVS